MPVKVLIPTPLRTYTDKQESVMLEGSTVGELMTQLTTTYSALKKHLYSDDGAIRSYVNVYVNDEDIRSLQKEMTPVSEKDVVSIIPSIAGGGEAPCAMVNSRECQRQSNSRMKRFADTVVTSSCRKSDSTVKRKSKLLGF